MVAAGDAPFAVRPDAETDLTVFVPKAGIVALDVSFGIDDVFLDHFALWQRFTPTEQADLTEQVGGGAHWMFTPARSLTLIHAVRRPLLAPAVGCLTADRRLGSAAVVLDGSLVASDSSTARIAVTGAWTDTVDDPESPELEARSTRLPLGSITVPRGETDEVAVASLRAQLPDTKRHLATIGLEAFSRFAGYFTEEQRVALGDRPVALDDGGVVAGTVEVRREDGSRVRAGEDFVVDGPRGTIRRVDGGALSHGARVLVRYVALPISRTSAEPGFPLLFRNTAPPPLPVVDDVVPSFAAAAGADGRHSGQVLRIHLARPWLVTGDGEQLAVVLDPGGATATAVARDPIVPGSTPLGAVSAADFPRAVSVVTGVDGEPDLVVHAVSFDAAGGRWYADVELADGFGYRPFVRLGVARYQPESIAGATLSPTVVEPVRLGVVRRTTAVRDSASVEVTVTGTGALGNTVLASVQRADLTIGDDDLRWRPAGDPVDLVARSEETATTWSGRIDLPETAEPLRVVIEELEPGRQDEAGAVVEVRVAVFVATVELPSA